jgi:hypothetical protein
MVRSYRGKEVDMISLAKKYEKNMALGNAHMNGKGDILGRNGKIVKTREEQLKEYYEGNRQHEMTINLKKDASEEIEKDLKKIAEENESTKPIRVKPTKTIHTDTTEGTQDIDVSKVEE